MIINYRPISLLVAGIPTLQDPYRIPYDLFPELEVFDSDQQIAFPKIVTTTFDPYCYISMKTGEIKIIEYTLGYHNTEQNDELELKVGSTSGVRQLGKTHKFIPSVDLVKMKFPQKDNLRFTLCSDKEQRIFIIVVIRRSGKIIGYDEHQIIINHGLT